MRHAHHNNNNNDNKSKIDSVQAGSCKRLSLNFIVEVLSRATATARNRNKNDSFTHIKHRAWAVGGENLVH